MSVYLKAAKILVDGDPNSNRWKFSGNAILAAGGNDLDIERMGSYFVSHDLHNTTLWYARHELGGYDEEFHCNTDLGNLCRSLMLLFMHEISLDNTK